MERAIRINVSCIVAIWPLSLAATDAATIRHLHGLPNTLGLYRRELDARRDARGGGEQISGRLEAACLGAGGPSGLLALEGLLEQIPDGGVEGRVVLAAAVEDVADGAVVGHVGGEQVSAFGE